MRIFEIKLATLIIAFIICTSFDVYSQDKLTTVSDTSIRILPNMVGFNNQMASSNEPWNDINRRTALKETEVGLLRYPGGTIANYWDMENQRLFKNETTIDTSNTNPRTWLTKENVIGWVVPMWPAINSISNLKLAYDVMSTSNDAEPAIVFVLNMITPGADYYALKWKREINQQPLSDDWWAMINDRLSRNIKMLDEAKLYGIKIKYIEFGNEYFFGKSYAGQGANGGAIVEPYSAGALNSDLVGAFPDNGRSYANAVNLMADTLLKRYPEVRLCAIGADANGSNPSRRNSWNKEVVKYIDKELVPAISIHLYNGIEEGNLVSTEENLGKAFSSWKHHWEGVKEQSSFPTDREYWFTEYNSNQDKKTWGHGLMNLYTLNTWLSEGNLGLSNYHQFAQNTVDGNKIFASTRVLALLARATRGKTLAQELKLNNDYLLEGTGKDSIPAIVAWKFQNDSDDLFSYFVTNFSSKPITINVSNIEGADGAKYVISKSSYGQTTDPGENSGTIDQSIELSPSSCVLFSAGEIEPIVSSVKSEKNKSGLYIYPNPGNRNIQINGSNTYFNNSSLQASIFEITGKTKAVFKGNLDQIEKAFNSVVETWKNGIYIIEFKNQHYSQRIKWIKN